MVGVDAFTIAEGDCAVIVDAFGVGEAGANDGVVPLIPVDDEPVIVGTGVDWNASSRAEGWLL